MLEKEGLVMGAKDSYEAICVAARKALVELKEREIELDKTAEYQAEIGKGVL
jgi:hypothetical protein